LTSFIEHRVKNLLIIEDDELQRKNIRELIGNGDVHTSEAASGKEALKILKEKNFDCIILDLYLPDISGLKLLKYIRDKLKLQHVPVIIYTGKELTLKEETELKQVAETIIIKDVRSPERLLDEVVLFLHRVEEKLPEEKREMLRHVRESDTVLNDKKVLIVDDDVRNIFSLTSMLEANRMKVIYAETGKAGIEMLKENPDIDVVLMDIMMPEMDGYEAMRRIRKIEKFKKLPVIALTAKALKGDREQCIEAGASDYLSKPVTSDQLLSLLRVWLYKW